MNLSEYAVARIVGATRHTGSTTWILKSAIKQPKCVIVSRNLDHSRQLENRYFNMLSKSVWYMKLYWKWFGREHPKFIPIHNSNAFYGLDLPVIFDNGAILED